MTRRVSPSRVPAPGSARLPARAALARVSPALVAGLVLTVVILGAALLAPLIAPFPPTAQNLSAGLQPPSFAHWFGTDQLGRDIFSRVLYAGRTDLRIAITAAVIPFVFGTAFGLLAGYFGRSLRGFVGYAADRITDTMIAFPFYVLVIAIAFAVGAGEGGIVLTFAVVGWVGYARVLGAMTAALRDAEWVRAARGGGLSHARVLVRHVLPNVLPQAIVLLATEIVLIMVAIVTLGYLGLGIQPPTPDWGTMISDGQPFVTSAWWLSAMPGIAVVLTGVAFSLLGDGIGDLLRDGRDPSPRGAGRARPADRARLRTRSRTRRGEPNRPPAGLHWSVRLPARGGIGAAGGDAGSGQAPGAAPDRGAAPGTVRVRGLAIENRQGSALVAGLDLAVGPGGALGIVGESGSGKSLTLRALLGMMPAGTRVAAGDIAVGGRVGMVFQDSLTALDPLTRVGSQLREAVRAGGVGETGETGETVRAGLAARGAPHSAEGEHGKGSLADRALELLETVGLPEPRRIARSYPHQLSGGQRQRVVIAMALASDPDVLLCDEPTTALDVTVQRQVLELLARLRRERGLTLVFVSHDLAVVAEVCERVLVMRGGQEVESGAVEAVVRDPRAPYTRALLAALPELPPLDLAPAAWRSSAAAPASSVPAPAPASSVPASPAPVPPAPVPPAPVPPAPAAPPHDRNTAVGGVTGGVEAPLLQYCAEGGAEQVLPAGSAAPAGSAPPPGAASRAGSVLHSGSASPEGTVLPAGSASPPGADPAPPLLELVDAEIRYGRAVAVRGASLVIAPGTALGIVGESGSGKTTLARAIVGQLPLSRGALRLDGAPVPKRRSARLRRAVQLVPQDPYSSLNPRLTIGATLAELAGRSRVAELLELARLDPSLAGSYPHELSGGQRQRAAIARALAVSPRLLVADEPTSALDVSVQAEIIALLQRLRRELGLTLVFVSHDLAVVHSLCEQIAVMRGGEIVEHGGPGFFTGPRTDYGRSLLEAVPRL